MATSRLGLFLGIRKVMAVRVFVAGGTGVIGRRLVPQLVARGHQVTATTTSAAKLGLLQQLRLPAIHRSCAAVQDVPRQIRPWRISTAVTRCWLMRFEPPIFRFR